MQARDAMTTSVATIGREATVREAAKVRQLAIAPPVKRPSSSNDRSLRRSAQPALRVAAEGVPGLRKVEDHTFVMPQRVLGALGGL